MIVVQQQQQQQQPQPQQVQQPPPLPAQPVTPQTTVNQPSRSIIVHPSGATSTNNASPTVLNSPKTSLPNATNSPAQGQPATPKSIVATPLQPGQAIPPGTTVFMSGGKTYCIPKASMTIAAQQQQQNQQLQQQVQQAQPSLPVTPLPPQQVGQSFSSKFHHQMAITKKISQSIHFPTLEYVH